MRKFGLLSIVIILNYAWGQYENSPPAKPIVGVSAGDKEITLYWDDRAEQVKDFEGYIIFRSTEPTFKEVQTITNGFGIPTFYKPIAQFDKVDSFTGPYPVSINGIQFNLGENTGLVHAWTDSGQVPGFQIHNGQDYYYAVCSYDFGDTSLNLPPRITNLDTDFNFIYDDSNTVVSTPNAPVAGYTAPEILTNNHVNSAMVYVEYLNHDTKEVEAFDYGIHKGNFFYPFEGPGTGAISVKILDPSKIKEGHVYQVVFQDTGYFHETVSYSVYDFTSGDTIILNNRYIHSKDIQEGLVFGNKFEAIGPISQHREWGPVFDGMSLQVFNHPEVYYVDSLSGWVAGKCNFKSHVETVGQQTVRIVYPANYEIRFFDQIVDSSVNGSIPTNFQVWNVTDDIQTDFRFEDKDNNLLLSTGDNVYPVKYVDSNIKYPWKIAFLNPIKQLKGNYLELDGDGDYASAPDNLSLDVGNDLDESLTVEAWIYPKIFGDYIISDEGYTLSTVSGKGVKFEVKGEGFLHSIVKTDLNFRENQWHHVVGIFDNATNKLAVGFDGEILWSQEDTTTFNLKNDDFSLHVGSFNDFDGFFNGAIKELRISDIVRYTEGIYDLDTTFTPDDNTRGLWHFNESPGSVSFIDTSSNGNSLNAEGDAQIGPPVLIPPEAGDVFLVYCTKPFRNSWTNISGDKLAGDLFQFETRAAYVDKNLAKIELDEIAVVPNPYSAAASWETHPDFAGGDRKIYFIHLPQRATIRIYSINGYLVDQLEHNTSVVNGAKSWDLKSKEGEEIAYGIYIYHVDAPGIGEKIGKFAVIK